MMRRRRWRSSRRQRRRRRRGRNRGRGMNRGRRYRRRRRWRRRRSGRRRRRRRRRRRGRRRRRRGRRRAISARPCRERLLDGAVAGRPVVAAQAGGVTDQSDDHNQPPHRQRGLPCLPELGSGDYR
jgi:hypothetical protein